MKLRDENQVIAERLMALTRRHQNWGFQLSFLYLRNVNGFKCNHKLVYRIYCELELNFRVKPKKRLYQDKPDAPSVPPSINQTWSMDFMHDQLGDGRSFRAFNVIDDFNREGLGVEIDFSLPTERSSVPSTKLSNGGESPMPFVRTMAPNISVIS